MSNVVCVFKMILWRSYLSYNFKFNNFWILKIIEIINVIICFKYKKKIKIGFDLYDV